MHETTELPNVVNDAGIIALAIGELWETLRKDSNYSLAQERICMNALSALARLASKAAKDGISYSD